MSIIGISQQVKKLICLILLMGPANKCVNLHAVHAAFTLALHFHGPSQPRYAIRTKLTNTCIYKILRSSSIYQFVLSSSYRGNLRNISQSETPSGHIECPNNLTRHNCHRPYLESLDT